MSLHAALLLIAFCLVLVALVVPLALVIARYEKRLLEEGPQRSLRRDLLLSSAFAVGIGLVAWALTGEMTLLVAGLAAYAGICMWLWLDSAGARARESKWGRDGAIRPTPRPRAEGPRRGRV